MKNAGDESTFSGLNDLANKLAEGDDATFGNAMKELLDKEDFSDVRQRMER